MKTTQLINTLEAEGRSLISVSVTGDWEAEVPSCPGWRLRDLVRHQGNVHRWAEAYVRERRPEYWPVPDEAPRDDELSSWFDDGLQALVASLRTADDGLECWTFLPGSPNPRAFWARRQVHETTLHRMDAELTAGVPVSSVEAGTAADGIDEILTGWHGRPRSLVRAAAPCVLAVRTEEGYEWTVRIGTEAPRTVQGLDGDWDCRINGPAQEIYAALWNRRPYDGDGLRIEGSAEVMGLWRRRSPIM